MIKQVIPNIGAGAAGGTAAGVAFKASGNLPIVPRLAVTGGAALVSSAGAQAGISGVQALVENSGIKEGIINGVKNSPHADISRVPSPGIEPFIKSPLENWEIEISPLETLLSSILSLNVCVLLLIFILLYLSIYSYLISNNKDLIFKLVNYWLVKFKFKKESIERVDI